MSKSLLVADNSITIQKSVGITFAQEDFKITYVDNGEDAVKRVKELKPDIVLADVEMPKKNGYDVCQAIKTDPETKAVPVLLLAGTHEPFDEARGKQAGADGYVIKPFESQALIDRVNTLIVGEAVDPQAVAPQAAPPTPEPPQAAAPTPPAPAVQPPVPEAPATPVPEASPAATIAGQSLGQMPQPSAAVPADAPMLDLESPQGEAPIVATPAPGPEAASPGSKVDDASFDFSFDGGLADSTKATSEEPTGPIGDPAPSQPSADPGASEGGDIWDFGGETEVAASQEPAPAPPGPSGPQIESPAEMANWSEAANALETAPEPTADTNEFGFDLSGDATPQPTEDISGGDSIAFETPDSPSFDLSEGEETSAPTPEADSEIAFGEPPAMETPEPASAADFESPMGIEMSPEPSTSVPEPSLDLSSTPEPSEPTPSLPAGISQDQLEDIVRKVFKEVIERIAWEVVPDLAESIIREELERLTKES